VNDRGVEPVDAAAGAAMRARVDALTKPPGSLGRLEELAVRLAEIAGGAPKHRYEARTILVGVGDHGVVAEGVSAYPQAVTAQMARGFLAGTAAIGALARAVRARVVVANFGALEDLPPHPDLLDLRVARGTANFARGAAMTREQLDAALAAGERAVAVLRARGPLELLALGEMGIGNTTSAAALTAIFADADVAAVVGRGTGIDDARLARKIAVVEAAVARVRGAPWDAVASEVGGFEIVALAGAILAAARARIPVVLDGFVVGAAALVARAIAPASIGYCIAAHRSQEPGHAVALARLGLRPLLELELRLGEGSGAALALPLIEAAARMACDMRTFAEAGVSDAET